jgi:hypothetical protein
MKTQIMEHVEPCRCRRGIVHDGELFCSACVEDAARRTQRFEREYVDPEKSKTIGPERYLTTRKVT